MPLRLWSRPLETHIAGLGVSVVIRCHGGRAAELHEAVVAAWVDCVAAPTSEAVAVDVLLDDDPDVVAAARTTGLTASTSLPHLLHDLSPAVTQTVITANAGHLLMLHAAGVAHRVSGACVALVAASGTGKTTATRLLTRELGYISDETIGVREDLGILAYPKPLSLLESDGSTIKAQRAVTSLGLRIAQSDVRLAGVLLLRRDPAGPELEVRPVRTVHALAELAPQTSYLARLDAPLHRLAATLEATGGLQHVRYREAASLAPLVQDLVGHVS
jgi:hypothetical protein